MKIVAAQLSTIEAQSNQPDLTLKFGMGGGMGWGDISTNNALYVGTIYLRITFYSSVLHIYLRITFCSLVQHFRITFYTSLRYLRITTSLYYCSSYDQISKILPPIQPTNNSITRIRCSMLCHIMLVFL